MSYTLHISQISFGGSGSDNPVPLTRNNYELSDAEQALSYTDMDVVAPFYTSGTKSITALIQLDPRTGQPLVGPNDLCRLPCPPYS